jgi:hypothetical protein
VRLDPKFDDRVMAAIQSPDVIPLRPITPRPWVLRPWTVSVSPLGGFLAAASIAAIAVFGLSTQSRNSVTDPSSPLVQVADAGSESGSVRQHQFVFVDLAAKSVAVVGDFNNWDASRTPMTRVSDDGVWTVTIPLAAGSYQYQFIINDSLRITDPREPALSNEFGSANSLLTIGPVVR